MKRKACLKTQVSDGQISFSPGLQKRLNWLFPTSQLKNIKNICLLFFLPNAEPHQKHSTPAAPSMKTTTVRLPSRTQCTTPAPRLWRGRPFDSTPIWILSAPWSEMWSSTLGTKWLRYLMGPHFLQGGGSLALRCQQYGLVYQLQRTFSPGSKSRR